MSNVRPQMNGCLRRSGRNPKNNAAPPRTGRAVRSRRTRCAAIEVALRLGRDSGRSTSSYKSKACSLRPRRLPLTTETHQCLARLRLPRLLQGSRCAAQTWAATSPCHARLTCAGSWSKMRLRPNRSLERTATGKALGPRGGQWHHSPRGPSALPVAAAQLQR